MSNLYMARHGETNFSREKVYYGFTDAHLNSIGEIQCKNVKNKLKGIKFDVVICSELERAIRSAEIISSLSRDRFIKCTELNEFNFGIWECKSYIQIQKEFETECKLWMEDWINYCIPEGESFNVFYNRVKQCIEKILGKYKDKNILLVAHEGTLRVISTVLLNLNAEDCWKFTFEFGAYSMFQVEDGFTIIKKINCI